MIDRFCHPMANFSAFMAGCATLSTLSSPTVYSIMPQQWFNNSDQINFENNRAALQKQLVLGPFDPQQHTLCFSHVPKTAGTSLENILAKNFQLSEVLHINAPDLNRCPELLALKKNPPKLICGHHPLHGLLYQLLPQRPLFHLTLLRDPVDRVLSYFNYVKAKTDHPMHRYAATSLAEFLHHAPSPELRNGQAKRFSGYLHSGTADDETLFKVAQQTLTHCFSLVLTTGMFDEGLLLLQQRLQLKDIYASKHNVSTRFINRQQLSATDLHSIESMNQADTPLFQWAQQQCQQLIQHNLTADAVQQFRIRRQQWAQLIG